jgi:hypothetical protein
VRKISKATVEMGLADGSKYKVAFPCPTVEMSQNSHDIYACGGLSGSTTITITGFSEVTTLPATVSAVAKKPAPKPKKPSVKASAARVRKASVQHAKLTKRIHDSERALIEMKNLKDKLDTELKSAREQLVASASA